MEVVKKTIAKTNGKKTTSMAVLYLLFEGLKLWQPDLISSNIEYLIMLSINTGLVGGILHKGWRNYSTKVYEYIKTKINSLKRH